MSTHPVSNFPEAEFRFSRADRRCSCSSSTRRYSCSSKRPPRSHSHCCSNDPAHGRWDSLPFTHYVLLRRFALYVKTWSRDGSYKPPPFYAFQSTSSSFSISPKKQSRPPLSAYEYDEATFALEQATPACAFALPPERPSTRPF